MVDEIEFNGRWPFPADRIAVLNAQSASALFLLSVMCVTEATDFGTRPQQQQQQQQQQQPERDAVFNRLLDACRVRLWDMYSQIYNGVWGGWGGKEEEEEEEMIHK